jgi:hypothetical protein
MRRGFFAIDDWHRLSLHMGQERTWNYCRGKYYNISQALMKHYCETCVTCLKKNPVTDASRGSRKPIQSRHYQKRFQLDLIDFCKLRKRDLFRVLMRWIMTIKDHSTGFIYLTALLRKRAKCVAYKPQEIFWVIGFPKIFNTNNGKEFTAKVVIKFL